MPHLKLKIVETRAFDKLEQSTISTIAERIVLSRLKEKIDENELLPKEQFGFIGRHSAEEQLLRITEIAMAMAMKKTTRMLKDSGISNSCSILVEFCSDFLEIF